MSLADRLAGCEQTPADSQVYLDGDVRRVLFGIDIDVGELLLARMIGVDGVIAHHPIGSRARLDFPQVIEGHEEQMVSAGIPQPIAHDAMLARKRPIERALHSANYDRVVDAARLLRMPLMNIHLAADLIGRRVFMDLVSKRVTATTRVGELLEQHRGEVQVRMQRRPVALEVTQHAQERQIGLRRRLVQPVEAVRPRAVVHHVGQVGVQDEGDAAGRRLSGAHGDGET